MQRVAVGDAFATRVYVVGEVLISLAALGGGAAMVFWGPEESVKLVGSGMVSAVTALWFSRRQSEQAITTQAQLANGKLTQVLDAQVAQQQRTDQIMGLVAQANREARR